MVNVTLFEGIKPGAFDLHAWTGRQLAKVSAAFVTSLHTITNFILSIIATWPVLLVLAVLGIWGWKRIRPYWQRMRDNQATLARERPREHDGG